MTFAWHAAVIPLQKKLPRLQDLLGKRPVAKASSVDAQKAAAMAWHRVLNKRR